MVLEEIYIYIYIWTKKWKIGYLTFHIFGTPWPRSLKFFLWCRVHLKMYQKNFQVSTTSGTWFGTTTKMAILAILFILYITIAGKSEFVKFLVLLICHFYHVDMLFRMLLVGPAPCLDWRRRDGGLPAAWYIYIRLKKTKIMIFDLKKN